MEIHKSDIILLRLIKCDNINHTYKFDFDNNTIVYKPNILVNENELKYYVNGFLSKFYVGTQKQISEKIKNIFDKHVIIGGDAMSKNVLKTGELIYTNFYEKTYFTNTK